MNGRGPEAIEPDLTRGAAELDIRVIVATDLVNETIARFGEIQLTRRRGRHDSDRHPGKTLVYLDAELPPAAAGASPEHQPWWPPQAGDIVIAHPYGQVDGATYIAEDHLECGQIRLRMVSAAPGYLYNPGHGSSIQDVWQEWPAISVVRAGVTYRSQKVGGGR